MTEFIVRKLLIRSFNLRVQITSRPTTSLLNFAKPVNSLINYPREKMSVTFLCTLQRKLLSLSFSVKLLPGKMKEENVST